MKFRNTENTKEPLADKSFNFTLKMIELFDYLQKEKREYIISRQIFRSGSNPGAMIREAKNAESGKDFIHKLSIGRKEIGETQYWLEILNASHFISDDRFKSLNNDAEEIKKMLVSSIITKKTKLGIRFGLFIIIGISTLYLCLHHSTSI